MRAFFRHPLWKKAALPATLALVLVLPFALRPAKKSTAKAADTVVIITSHNEAIRSEFARAFAAWYEKKHQRTIEVDWRVIGGTSVITTFLESEYVTAFQNHWEKTLRRPWSNAVRVAFQNSRLPADASEEEQLARAEFLQSDVSCGIDIMWGGGPYDFIRQAEAGRFVASGIEELHPDWFTEDILPLSFAGEIYRDAEGRWQGTVLSGFGMLNNIDALGRLGIKRPPQHWADLADPRLFQQIGIADPAKSSTVTKAFENVIQQQMDKRWTELQAEYPEKPAAELEAQAVREGWTRGLQLLQLICANARYFTESSQRGPIDTAQGDVASAVTIDFYGRQQAESLVIRANSHRIEYSEAKGGAVNSVDPIAMLRGAPHRFASLAFIEFVLSPEGQRLWNFRPGTPGGPVRYALRRLPVRRDFYHDLEAQAWRSDPSESPYETATLIYRPAWTVKVFRELAFVMRAMSLDSLPELQTAWKKMIATGTPPEAMAKLQDMSVVDYETVNGRIKTVLASRDRIAELKLAQELGEHFRRQYAEAAALASGAAKHEAARAE